MKWIPVNEKLPVSRTVVKAKSIEDYLEDEPVSYAGEAMFMRSLGRDLLADDLSKSVAMQDGMWLDVDRGTPVSVTHWMEIDK